MREHAPLPPTFAAARESLRALACYALSPARKARTGRIGLRPTTDGFGTPPFDDGSRIIVRGDRLIRDPGGEVRITTVRAATEFLGIECSPDPGVGHDLPPYAPDVDLDIDADASRALGAWYARGQRVIDALGGVIAPESISEAQLWPEHFDLATIAQLAGGQSVNVGFSPGDADHAEPYVYVGPHDTGGLSGDDWNEPFGASLTYGRLLAGDDPEAKALAFILHRLSLLRGRERTPVPADE